MDKVTWLLGDMQHAEVDMRRLILELVDRKVFHIQEGQDEEADSRWAVQDKMEQYSALQPKVDAAFLCACGFAFPFCLQMSALNDLIGCT